jgi:phosphoribosylanthranilate isomerase
VQVKICGITRPEDGVAAVAAGADAIGLVFFSGSKRAVTIAEAQAICEVLPPLTTVVGLFVDAEAAEVQTVMQAVPLNLLQFHGAEKPDFCAGFGRPWIKALPVLEGVDLEQRLADYAAARAVLLDSAVGGQFGGTGHRFDWRALPPSMANRFILAGGLDPDNVAEAIATAKPIAVDVSSGVESAPGIKDSDKMRRFVANARRASEE